MYVYFRYNLLQVNVIPGVAKATVNHRVSPGESIDDVIARDREVSIIRYEHNTHMHTH